MKDLSTNSVYIVIDRYYNQLLIGVFALLVLSVGYVIIWPKYIALQQSGALEYQASVKTLQQRQQYLEELQLMQQNYERVDQRLLGLLPIILPAKQDPIEAFAEIENLLRDSGFTIESINVTPIDATKAQTTTKSTTTTTNTSTALPAAISDLVHIVQISVNITSTQASYQNFKKFLEQLERYPHLLELDTINYTPDATSYTLIFKTYQSNPTSSQSL